MLLHCLVSTLFIAATITASVAAVAAPVVVETTLGQIVGTTDGTVDSFLGIQFATVGPRFSRSTLIETPSQESINATSFGPYCWQSIPPGSNESFFLYAAQPQEEECLYLNIWRPVNNVTNTSLLSTMVYIHGGGFVFGSAAEAIYNGTHLAREHNVVVVSANYRLGLFGFLVTGDNGYGGLNGIHDQINALQWVQHYIESFGGNPNDVTIFGESAGSMSVCMLNVSPLAKGLFHRSIQQSGECAVGLAVPNTPQVGAKNTQTILELANASSVDELANATLYPADKIAPYSTMSLIGWHTVDGWVLPKQPKQLYSDSSNIVPTDMIVGSNSYDSPFLLSSPPNTFISMAMNMETEINGIFNSDYGPTVLEAYSPDKYGGNQVAAYAQFWGDFYFRCAGRQFAALVADHLQGKIYLYNYAHLASVDPIVLNGLRELADINDTTWASHGADLPMILDTFQEFADGWWYGGDNVEPTAADVALGQEMRARWISFAKTGNPNTADYSGWTPVPKGENRPGLTTSIPTFSLQAGGGKMSTVDEKVGQCSVFGFSPTENATATSGVTSKDWIMGVFWLVALILAAELFA